jgi:hypothetical protein
MILLLKQSKAYVPDYMLFYLDKEYDLSKFYQDEALLLQMKLSRQNSSLMRKNTQKRENEDEE